MSEMNPIVATLLQILESRKKDLALAQRREEAKAQQQFEMERLSQAERAHKLTAQYQAAQLALNKFRVEREVEDTTRSQFLSGARKLQGTRTLPSTTKVYLPDLSGISDQQPDIANATMKQFYQPSELTPNDVQYVQGPDGPFPISDVVSRPEARQISLENLLDKAGMDAITAKLKSDAELPSKLILEEAKGANAKSVAQLNQEAATNRTEAQIAAQKLIANNRDATAKEVARIRAQGGASQDAEMLAPMVESVILGEVPLAQIPIAKNTRGAVINSAKSQGFVIPDAAITKKVPFTHAMFAITDRIENDIIPKLAKNPAEAKGKGILAKLWPTELANEFAKIELDATTQAREAGEKGNFSNSDIGRALHSLGDPGFTQDQIRDRLRTLKNKIYNKLDNEYLGGLPDKQKILILQKYNYNPSDLLATDKNGKIISSKEYPTGIPKYIFQDGMWGVYNPSTGKIRRVD